MSVNIKIKASNITCALICFPNTGLFSLTTQPLENSSRIDVMGAYFWPSFSSYGSDHSTLCLWNASLLHSLFMLVSTFVHSRIPHVLQSHCLILSVHLILCFCSCPHLIHTHPPHSAESFWVPRVKHSFLLCSQVWIDYHRDSRRYLLKMTANSLPNSIIWHCQYCLKAVSSQFW